jgi:hypothetical protein
MSEPQDREAARRKLLGRLLIIGLGLLLAVYILAMFLPKQG